MMARATAARHQRNGVAEQDDRYKQRERHTHMWRWCGVGVCEKRLECVEGSARKSVASRESGAH